MMICNEYKLHSSICVDVAAVCDAISAQIAHLTSDFDADCSRVVTRVLHELFFMMRCIVLMKRDVTSV